MNFSTKYLELDLKNPLVAGASPLSNDLNKVRELEDGGIAAITLYSLFEEQITQNLIGSGTGDEAYENAFSEAASYFPEVNLLERGLESYLEHLRRVKEAVSIPVIGSLNGTREGEWAYYASFIEEAGADALELNLYFLPTDFDVTSAEMEDRCLKIVRQVRERINIPLSVKLSPFFTVLPNFAKRLVDAGVDGLVLFNRFYQPDIDTDELEVRPALDLSHSSDLRLRLRWLAMLSGRLPVNLAVSGGVHTGLDLAKSIMVGADCAQIVSTLLINGPQKIGETLDELSQWMEKKGYSSLEDFRGCLNYRNCTQPEALERANYMRVLKSRRS